MDETTREDGSELIQLLKGSLGVAPDRTMRLFAAACCRRVSRFLADDWRQGIEVAERFAEGRATCEELAHTLGYLTRDFEEVVESDNGEIYAAKQAVLAALDLTWPFDPTEAAAKARWSVCCGCDREEARWEEEAWQLAEFRAYLAGGGIG
jgi:hypothetical protein